MNEYQISASVTDNTIYTSENSGKDWESQNSGNGFWSNIVGSNDGKKLIAASIFDYLYSSSDRGVTWNRLNIPQNLWFGLASSSDASVLYAGGITYIFKSIDGGITWFPLNTIIENIVWISIACSIDGQTIVAAGLTLIEEKPGILCISLDGGLTWIPVIVKEFANWRAVACSSDGKRIYAVDSSLGGSIWGITITKNSGIEVKRLTTANSNYWYSLACSSDGSTIISGSVSTNISVRIKERVIESFEGISTPNILNYLRSNNIKGKTLSQIAKEIHSVPKPRSIGTYNNNVFISTDFGNNWKVSLSVPSEANTEWNSVAISAYGDFMSYSIIYGPLYTSNDGGISWVIQPLAGIKNWTRLFISSEPVCVIGDTRILMGDGTFKKIKEIVRGDEVITDKENNIVKKVADVVSSYYDGYIIKIPKGTLKNTRSVYVSEGHPIWINKGQNRTYSKQLNGIEKIHIHQLMYNLQFEEEGSFYAETIKMDSLSPNFYRNKLPQELYFNQFKYDESIIIKNEDDPRRGKPKMI